MNASDLSLRRGAPRDEQARAGVGSRGESRPYGFRGEAARQHRVSVAEVQLKSRTREMAHANQIALFRFGETVGELTSGGCSGRHLDHRAPPLLAACPRAKSFCRSAATEIFPTPARTFPRAGARRAPENHVFHLRHQGKKVAQFRADDAARALPRVRPPRPGEPFAVHERGRDDAPRSVSFAAGARAGSRRAVSFHQRPRGEKTAGCSRRRETRTSRRSALTTNRRARALSRHAPRLGST